MPDMQEAPAIRASNVSAVLNKPGLRGYDGEVRGELAMTREKKPDRDWKEYNEHLVQRGEILM